MNAFARRCNNRNKKEAPPNTTQLSYGPQLPAGELPLAY